MTRVPPYEDISDGLKHGAVVPFFGAAASAVYRPDGEAWEAGKPFMPFGSELARDFARRWNYQSETAQVPNLAFLASWVEHVQGTRARVNARLRESFAVAAAPGLLHTSLAALDKQQLFITTNYDDLLETALQAREPYVVTDRGDKGLWLQSFGDTAEKVAPNGGDLLCRIEDAATGQPKRPIIFKMHGSVVRADEKQDYYLITEEDYVDFLGRGRGSYLPPYIHRLLNGRTLLFLGYSLEDWNVRVIVRKLLRGPARTERLFYAIVQGRTEHEQELWRAKNLNVYGTDLRVFAKELAKELTK